jgi:hypothetical protein
MLVLALEIKAQQVISNMIREILAGMAILILVLT